MKAPLLHSTQGPYYSWPTNFHGPNGEKHFYYRADGKQGEQAPLSGEVPWRSYIYIYLQHTGLLVHAEQELLRALK